MQQLELFSPANLWRNRLQAALDRLDLDSARRFLHRLEELWPQFRVSWELEVLDFFARRPIESLDLDCGFDLWHEFEQTSTFGDIPTGSIESMERHYFRRLLAVDHRRRIWARQPLQVRTKAGRSLSEFNLRAGFPRRALRFATLELAAYGETPELRFQLGNCCLAAARRPAARAHYREGLLSGRATEKLELIDDDSLVSFLKRSDLDGPWAVIQACIARRLPVPHFRSDDDLSTFLAQHPWLQRERIEVEPGSSPWRKFYACLTISENKRFVSEGLLLRARRTMKELNPRVHHVYMRRIETLPRRNGV